MIKSKTKERDLRLLGLLDGENLVTDGLKNCDKNRLCAMWAWKCLFGSATVRRPVINTHNYGMFGFKMVLSNIVLTHLVDILARELDKDLANLVCGQIKKIEELVQKLSIPLPVFPEPATRIQRFFGVNSCLPEQMRWSVTPIAGHNESFLQFTEQAFLDLIYNIPGGEGTAYELIV